MIDDGFSLPAIPYQKIDPQFLRQIVPDPTGAAPGTVVVDTSAHHLYLVRDGGMAIRYGVGLGRAGFEWSGRCGHPVEAALAEMDAAGRDGGARPEAGAIQRRQWRHAGRPRRIRSARARSICSRTAQDTLYRLHGSPEWNSIGKSVSSGCVRLINQDIIDLYDRVPNQTPVIVTSGVGGAYSGGRYSGASDAARAGPLHARRPPG